MRDAFQLASKVLMLRVSFCTSWEGHFPSDINTGWALSKLLTWSTLIVAISLIYPCPIRIFYEGFFFDALGTYKLCDKSSCSCADASRYCLEGDLAGTRARQLCPQTCRCDDPVSEVAVTLPSQGCPSNCRQTQQYLNARAGLPCMDSHSNSSIFQSYTRQLRSIAETLGPNEAKYGAWWATNLDKYGCGFIAYSRAGSLGWELATRMGTGDLQYGDWRPDFCLDGGFRLSINSIAYICPVSCACTGDNPLCPATCPLRQNQTR